MTYKSRQRGLNGESAGLGCAASSCVLDSSVVWVLVGYRYSTMKGLTPPPPVHERVPLASERWGYMRTEERERAIQTKKKETKPPQTSLWTSRTQCKPKVTARMDVDFSGAQFICACRMPWSGRYRSCRNAKFGGMCSKCFKQSKPCFLLCKCKQIRSACWLLLFSQLRLSWTPSRASLSRNK